MSKNKFFNDGTELKDLKNSNPIAGCSLSDGELKQRGDKISCTFHLTKGDRAIEAEIVLGDQGAYQVRFDNEADAQKVLTWVKDCIAPTLSSKDQSSLLAHARVTAPPSYVKDGKYLFRLMGENQLNALINEPVAPQFKS